MPVCRKNPNDKSASENDVFGDLGMYWVKLTETGGFIPGELISFGLYENGVWLINAEDRPFFTAELSEIGRKILPEDLIVWAKRIKCELAPFCEAEQKVIGGFDKLFESYPVVDISSLVWLNPNEYAIPNIEDLIIFAVFESDEHKELWEPKIYDIPCDKYHEPFNGGHAFPGLVRWCYARGSDSTKPELPDGEYVPKEVTVNQRGHYGCECPKCERLNMHSKGLCVTGDVFKHKCDRCGHHYNAQLSSSLSI